MLDTTGIWGEVITAVFAALAQEESRLISERTKAGMARVEATGKHCGRPRKQVDVARLRRLREKGMTISAIAKRMKLSRAVVWERSGCGNKVSQRSIKNPVWRW